MKKIASIALLATICTCAFAQSATETGLTYTFDFADPESLTPPVAEPAVKEGVSVRDITFTEGPIAISFTENPSSNTHVRIFHSYNAGCDLRIYDGESMHVTLTEPGYYLQSISFEMSLTGTTSDIDFNPSAGTYIWEENLWQADSDDTTSLTLTSILQSRTTRMTITLNTPTHIDQIPGDTEEIPIFDNVYYDLQGRPLNGKPQTPGIYIHNGRKISI
ncbi:MAG: hypothetical protein K2H86_01610 [Muribaculaceae bacterium]|nr:hypothetical protein [Muribaculaceae bacterium]